MALDQKVKNGVVYITGTTVDIEAARLAGTLVVGRLYLDTDTNSMGRAISNGNTSNATLTDVIRWEVTSTWVMGQITDAVATETTARQNADTTLQGNIDAEATARQNADTTLQGNIDAEATARQNADTTLQSNIDAEELRAITREDAIDTGYKAADAIIVTDLTAALNTAVEALKDSRVTSFTGVTYTDAATLVLSDDIVGATPEDGVHLYKFTAADVMAQAIVETGVGPDINITYNDIIKVTVDGGVITAAVLADDALRAKFVSIDTSIAALETATTHSAIVGNFEMGTFIDITAGGRISFRSSQAANNDIESDLDGNAIVDIAGKLLTAGGSEKTVNTHFVDLYAAIESVESNLLQADSGTEVVGGFVKLGGELTRTTTFTGAQDVSFSDVNVVKVPYLVYDCFTATRNAQGYVTGQGAKTTGKVHVWFDENGDPINLYVPN